MTTLNPFPASRFSRNITFFVFNFSDFFDGLIGYQSLQEMGIIILSAPNLLQLPDTVIQMYRKTPEIRSIVEEFEPGEIKQLELLAKEKEGDMLVSEDCYLTPDIYVESGVYNINNHWGKFFLGNKSDKKVKLELPQINLPLNNFEITPNPGIKNTFIDIFELLRTEHLNDEETKALKQTISKYKNVFYVDETVPLSFTNMIKHEIKTKDDIPIYTKSYRYPFVHRTEIQRQIQDMLRKGIIRHSISPWSSPIWVVPKKLDASGRQKWRLVIDYRKLNDKTINDKYPLPNITDILDKLGRSQYFSTLDLASGFHQIEVNHKDIEKTAFNVEHGHYEFIRMPFGLKNAPSTFQRVMDNVLRELIGHTCLVYMDDIIIFSSSLQEHMSNLAMVLERLDKYDLKIQLDKSEFLRKEVAFLGHIVTPEGVKPNPDKIKAVREWPLPSNEKELRGFLGTIGYYRKFIRDFAKIIKPLTLLLRKKEEGNDKKLTHTEDSVEAFEKCKKILTDSDILQYPDFSKDFILTTDASNFAIGAVLSQGPIGKDKPIAYASRTLNRTEENYSTIEKELLAIVWGCKNFRPYLFGRKFVLYTDHKPLTYACNLKNPNGRLTRWKLSLMEYDYEIKYRPGKQNIVADGLSRIVYECNYNEIDQVSNNATMNSSDNQTVHSAETDDTNFIQMTEQPLNAFSNQIILKLGEQDFTFEEIFPKKIRYTITEPNFPIEKILDIFKVHLNFKVINCIHCPETLITTIQEVYRTYFSQNVSLRIRISQKILIDIKTLEEQNSLIEETHEVSHRGIQENCAEILRKYYFPDIKIKVRKYILLCKTCNVAKYERKPYKLKFAETPIPRKPFDIVHIDVFISQPNLFLSAVDKLSRFGVLIPLRSRSIVDMKEALINLITIYGNPKLIVCDNEPSLKSIEIRGLLNSLDIEMYFTPSNHSEVNGIVERFHSTLAEIFRCVRNKHNDLSEKELFLISTSYYNDTIHSVTGMKPKEIFFGIKDGEERFTDMSRIIESRNKIYDEVILKLEQKQKKQLDYFNENREEDPSFEENEELYLKPQGIKKKTQPKFRPIEMKENKRKTIIDKNNRKLHKIKLRRKRINQP